MSTFDILSSVLLLNQHADLNLFPGLREDIKNEFFTLLDTFIFTLHFEVLELTIHGILNKVKTLFPYRRE